MSNLLVMMSGGTTQVINATLCGVIEAVKSSGRYERVFAGVPGIIGVLSDNIVELTDLTSVELEQLKYTPSSCAIGTTRVEFLDNGQIEEFNSIIEKYSISSVINIGGNGTAKQSRDLESRLNNVSFVSLPKTVDNDLGDSQLSRCFFTPGFPSVVNYWVHKVAMLNNESLGAYSHDKVLVAQTFGRETGFITGAARLADPDRKLPLLLLLPEDQQPVERVISAIQSMVAERGRAIVVMSEGYDVGNVGGVKDYSGQVMFSSSKHLAAQLLVNHCIDHGIQARAFIPGIDQRSEVMYTTQYDIDHAYGIGNYAVNELSKGNSGFLALIGETPDNVEYTKINYDEFDDLSRTMDACFISSGEFDVSNKYLDYLRKVCSDRRRISITDNVLPSAFFPLLKDY